ncbi:NAD-binding protein [Neptunomonas phycophila]|uniref:NAD-binding protein n=4 Tax=Neptunomonas phycophila TaxID=1572645 RepID=A0AAW7XNP4_9GAMM|nr:MULTISPECIES: potassium channel protein [Neptunomonas]MBT3144055.1 NAD-binding protein [Neptunomonas phycophila]MDN2660995.1 NAD-binding protein [Neptunomonas sp. CHC150]MDO6454659.1 NAD-binding protein [Neptunomonas phycophila]MDO6467356.1 NAD-binding protein [Neptunomonas phycophila]MDO6782770.1 NAD-binding protein [Neptunomonas phycophila]
MNNIIYLVLRRLRMPLITLIVIYAISVLGFVLIPGQDDEGNPWRMGFFHAVYFVSFMGSTIGFGEIPYPFTDAQRMWALIMIYATVISWLYSIGSMLALLQEPGFGRMLRRRSFTNEVFSITEPFYLVCGYGVTGKIVVEKLALRDIRTVVIDVDQDCIDELDMCGLPLRVPGLCADAALPDILDDAGVQRDNCIGVLALTDDDNANLSISIASKLLKPNRLVISRTESDVTTGNLLSFGTDIVIDPFVTYARYLSMAINARYKHLVYDWLINPTHRPLSSANQKIVGRWIICGFGRFGRQLYKAFRDCGVTVTIIDSDPINVNKTQQQVWGVGTEAHTLKEAGVEEAVGIIAGTNNDADNLSIIMTARELNPKLITVVRQNLDANHLIFSNSKANFIMESGGIIANQILAQIKTPLLAKFIQSMNAYNDIWAHELLNRMSRVVGDQEVDSWAFTVNEEQTPALMMALNEGKSLKLNVFMKDPRERKRMLNVFPLLLYRRGEVYMLPGELDKLMAGDQILLCGLTTSFSQIEWTINNYNVLYYVLTGEDRSRTLLSRWFREKPE